MINVVLDGTHTAEVMDFLKEILLVNPLLVQSIVEPHINSFMKDPAIKQLIEDQVSLKLNQITDNIVRPSIPTLITIKCLGSDVPPELTAVINELTSKNAIQIVE